MAAKLKFKQQIKAEEGLLFSKIRSEVMQSCLTSGIEPKQSKVTENNNSRCQRHNQPSEAESKPKFAKTYSAVQIKKQLDEAVN